MARRTSALSFNLQLRCPVVLGAALDLIAERANGGEGISRSALIRSVLAEFVELKLGPNLRKAITAWERSGGAMLSEFLRQQVPPVPGEPEPHRALDPSHDRAFMPDPLDPDDPLHKLVEKREQVHKEQSGVAAPHPTERVFRRTHPFEPAPKNFPLQSDFIPKKKEFTP
jgi:hypothetical protein